MKNTLLILAVLFPFIGFAQKTVFSLDGKNTFNLDKGVTIGANITDAQINLSYYDKKAIKQIDEFSWGVELNGGNERGFLPLIRNSEFVVGTKANVYLSYAYLLSRNRDSIVILTEAISAMQKIYNQLDTQRVELEGEKKDLQTKISSLEKRMALLTILNQSTKKIDSLLADGKKALQSKIKEFEQKENEMSDLNTELPLLVKRHGNLIKKAGFNQLIPFFRVGFSNQSFDILVRDEVTDSSYIKKEKFTGQQLQLGTNLSLGGHLFIGGSFNYELGNTLNKMTKTEFRKENITIIDTTAYSSFTKKDAYVGDYKRVERVSLSFDVTALLTKRSMDKKLILGLNLLNAKINFKNPIQDKTTLDLGMGINFFKNQGKFIGGISLKASDITNTDVENGKTLFSKFTIGFNTAFTLFPLSPK